MIPGKPDQKEQSVASEDSARWTLEEAIRQLCPSQIVSDYDTITAAMDRAGVKPSVLLGLRRAIEHPDPDIRSDSRMNAEYERARKALLQDFRSRLIRNEVKLAGVQTAPERLTMPTAIPGSWAADFRFDFEAGIIHCDEHRWVAVTASLGSSKAEEVGAEQSSQPPEPVVIRADQVAILDDETILALLEEHARRVVEGPDAKLIAPGKISLMPIIQRKMRQRAEQKELLATLASEAAWLAEWIKTRASSHQVPTEGAIKNALRKDYSLLSAQSKDMKP
jgi:hypothetical protein